MMAAAFHLASPVLADWVRAWLVPIVLGVLVIAVAWIGVQWSSSEHLDRLAPVPLFSALSRRQLRELARAAAREHFGIGDRIVREREADDGFYVVQEGIAAVTVAGDRKASLEPGGYFGEMAVIDGGPRSATITAETDPEVDPPNRDGLVQMCRQLRIVRQTDWGQARPTRRRWLPF